MATGLARAVARLEAIAASPRCKVGKYYDSLSAADKALWDDHVIKSPLKMRVVWEQIKTEVPFAATAYRSHALKECRCR